MTLQDIQNLTAEFSLAYDTLVALGNVIEAEIAGLKQKHLAAITDYSKGLSVSRFNLNNAIFQNAQLFQKPKTRTFNNVRVGLQKQKGKIIIPDEERAISRLNKLLGSKNAAPFLNVKITVNKTAAADLPLDLAKKCGIEMKDAGEAVLIKPIQGEISKLITALLEEPRA